MTPMCRNFGFRHERRITLSPQGQMVTGADRLVPVRPHREAVAVSPCASISIPMCGCRGWKAAAILLKLPGGEGWRFRAGGGELDVEESIYLGGEVVRRTEQLVVTGHSAREPCRSCMGVRTNCRLTAMGCSRRARPCQTCANHEQITSGARLWFEFTLPKNSQGQKGQSVAGGNRRQRQEAQTLQGIQSLSLRSRSAAPIPRWTPIRWISTAAARWSWTR